MALAVGMIVDSSIVVMENIHRFRVEEAHDGDVPHLKDLVVRAVAQVRAPVSLLVALTLIPLLGFLMYRRKGAGISVEGNDEPADEPRRNLSDRLIVFVQAAGDITTEEIVEQKIPEMSAIIRAHLSDYVVNTYAEVRGRFNRLFVVLRSTRDVHHVTNELQRLFESDNEWYYNILNWDPAQLPLPGGPDPGPDRVRKLPRSVQPERRSGEALF